MKMFHGTHIKASKMVFYLNDRANFYYVFSTRMNNWQFVAQNLPLPFLKKVAQVNVLTYLSYPYKFDT